MPAPILAGIGRSVAAAAQAAARVATTVVQGVGRAAASVTQSGARAGGTAATAAGRAAAGASAAGGAGTAAAPAAAAVTQGRTAAAASQAGQSARQGAFRPQVNPASGTAGTPPTPMQFLKDLAKDWWMEGAQAAASRGGGGGRGGRRRRRNPWSLDPDDEDEYGEQGEPVARGGSGRGNADRPGTSLGMLREAMNRWERVQRGIGTVADLAITAQAAGNFTQGRSAGGAVRSIARHSGRLLGQTFNNIQSPGSGTAQGALQQLGIQTSPTKMLVDFGFKLADSVRRLDDFGKSLVEARRPLADLDGRMAAATAQLDVDRVRRNIRLAGRTGASAEFQTRAQSRLEEALAPGQVAIANAINRLIGVVENAAAFIVETVNKHPLVEPLLKFLGAAAQKELEKNNQVLVEFSRRLGGGEFDKRRFEELPETWGGKPKPKE